MKSHLVEAPAFFGEGCLWVPFDDWDTDIPVHCYAARCEARVEVLSVDRSAMQVVIDRFSPWLAERFDLFRSAVCEGVQRIDSEAKESMRRAHERQHSRAHAHISARIKNGFGGFGEGFEQPPSMPGEVPVPSKTADGLMVDNL